MTRTTAILGLESVVKLAPDEADIWARIKDALLVSEVVCVDKPWQNGHRYCRYVMTGVSFMQMKVVIVVFRGVLFASLRGKGQVGLEEVGEFQPCGPCAVNLLVWRS